jgi:hypothetical protein
MMKLKLLGAAVVLSSALASPAIAQQVISNPGYCAQFYPNANCQNKGPGNPYTGDYQARQQAMVYPDNAARPRAARRVAYRNNAAYGNPAWVDTDPGVAAANYAARTTGAAVGTAAAIAAAPFGGWGNSYAAWDTGSPGWGNSYAWDRGYYGYNGDPASYATRNGFACTPGTWFRGDDGRQHPCQ